MYHQRFSSKHHHRKDIKSEFNEMNDTKKNQKKKFFELKNSLMNEISFTSQETFCVKNDSKGRKNKLSMSKEKTINNIFNEKC